MRYGNRVLALSLGFMLVFGQTAYAEIIVPPMPMAGGAWGQTPESRQGTTSGGYGTVTSEGPSSVAWPSEETEEETDKSGPGVQPANSQSQPLNHVSQSVPEPVVAAEGAVLLDATTGKVLYGKNQDMQFYPASITKIMTALVVLERSSLNDVVTFSASATTNLESGATSLNIAAGDKLTVEQCLYGLLLKSANEIGNGLAEHVAGSVSGFADVMNKRAQELGCKNTNFKNPHGLNDTEHKTTPYDMALIMRAAMENPVFREIDSTTSYQFPATKKAEARTITMGHKMMYPTDSRYYSGITGGKTGYTSKAGNTLVTVAERGGRRLIAVVMKASGTQYSDTKQMLDYGFANDTALPMPEESKAEVGPGVGENAQKRTATGEGSGVIQHNGADESAEAQREPSWNSSVNGHGWLKDGNRWIYLKEDGSRAAGEWLDLGSSSYWIDTNGYMATGWRQFSNGAYYYFADDGHMVSKEWVQDGSAWYYMGDDGVLMTNTTVPGGYKVNEYGIWIQE